MGRKKNILVISGHDPTGGAGIIADTETAIGKKIRVLSILSCITAQNSSKVINVKSVPSGYISKCYELIRSEFKIDGIKIGLLPSVSISKEVQKILSKKENKNIPIIFDPIFNSGSNYKFLSRNTKRYIIENILKKVDLITPNRQEYIEVKKQFNISKSSRLKHILVTNYNIQDKYIYLKLINTKNRMESIYKIKKSRKEFRGTGCTFSTKLTCELINTNNIEMSIKNSLLYMSKLVKISDYKGNSQFYLDRNI